LRNHMSLITHLVVGLTAVYVFDESGYVKVRLVQVPALAPVQIAGINCPAGR